LEEDRSRECFYTTNSVTLLENKAPRAEPNPWLNKCDGYLIIHNFKFERRALGGGTKVLWSYLPLTVHNTVTVAKPMR